MPLFDAILFDFDGVLVDSEPLHHACWAQVLAPFGVELTWEAYRGHYLGIDDRDMLHRIADEASPPLDWQTLWAQYPAKKECFQRKMEQPPFSPELPILLEKLHGHYKLGVVSSSARIEIEPPLQASKLRRYFDALVTGQDVKHLKPAPDPYLLGAKLLGAERPLVVEDSAAGIASGWAAGFEVLHVTSVLAMPSALLERLSGGTTPA